MKKIFLTAAIIFTLAAPVFVSAQTCDPSKPGIKCAGGILDQVAGTEKTGLTRDFAGTVATVIKAVLALVGTIFLVLTIYAGIMWMTAQGEEEKVTKAKEIIKASIIGLIIIMSAYAITSFVTSRLAGSTGATNTPTSQMGCCDNTNTGQKVQSLASDCTFSGEVWTAGACS